MGSNSSFIFFSGYIWTDFLVDREQNQLSHFQPYFSEA